MNMQPGNDDDEKFSDDPEEQLRMENEILKLKLKAELGGDFESMESTSPDIENIFLKNILEFEHAHENAEVQTVYDFLGKPSFIKSVNLNDKALSAALKKMVRLLAAKNIVVDYLAEYPDRLKYEFITEELFQHETEMMMMPGMTTHYIYEEFHPNHEYDIRERANDFIRHWFEQSFNEYSSEVAKTMMLADGSTMQREQLFTRMQLIFDSYDRFDNTEFFIADVSFELNKNSSGLGFAEGGVRYDAILETGEVQHYEGPFKLYMQNEYEYWQIFYFVWPGFSW